MHFCKVDGRVVWGCCFGFRVVLLEVLVCSHRPGFSPSGVYAGVVWVWRVFTGNTVFVRLSSLLLLCARLALAFPPCGSNRLSNSILMFGSHVLCQGQPERRLWTNSVRHLAATLQRPGEDVLQQHVAPPPKFKEREPLAFCSC